MQLGSDEGINPGSSEITGRLKWRFLIDTSTSRISHHLPFKHFWLKKKNSALL